MEQRGVQFKALNDRSQLHWFFCFWYAALDIFNPFERLIRSRACTVVLAARLWALRSEQCGRDVDLWDTDLVYRPLDPFPSGGYRWRVATAELRGWVRHEHMGTRLSRWGHGCAGGDFPPRCPPEAVAGTPSEAPVPFSPHASCCGRAAERN